MEQRCHECHKDIDEIHLQKCPICFRLFCDDHAFNMSNRLFCSQRCAEYFFSGDPDEEEKE